MAIDQTGALVDDLDDSFAVDQIDNLSATDQRAIGAAVAGEVVDDALGRIDAETAETVDSCDFADDGPDLGRKKHCPLRRCIVSGVVQDRARMIRFVVAPDGTVVPDLEARLPGRGFWVESQDAVLQKAVKGRFFARAARRAVTVDPSLVDRVGDLLERRCMALVGLMRRAGEAVSGFEKVRSALRSGRIGHSGPALGALLAAADGAADGRNALRALAGAKLPIIEIFSARVLGAAFGRDHTVHAALARGALVEQLIGEVGRLAHFRTPSTGQTPVVSPSSRFMTKPSGTDD